jgi:phosphatidylglycerophosphate synthase
VNVPVRDAIVLAGPDDARATVAGVPLLLRTVLTLQRAGVERCTIVGADPPADPRIRLALATSTALAPQPDDRPRLVIGPGTVVDTTLLDDLQARVAAGATVELEHAGARVRVASGARVLEHGGRPEAPRAGTLAPVTSPPSALLQALLRNLENHHDGYLDRLVHRRVSRVLTPLLLRTPLTPNAITVLGVAIGAVGGLLLGARTFAGVLAGVACLVLSGALDCCDGEVARVRFTESKLGHWLDVTGDTLVHVAVLAGVTVHLARAGAVPGRGVLAALGVAVLAAFAVISWSEQTESARRRIDAWENGFLDGVLSPLTTRDWHVFVVAFALAGRLDLLFLGGAIGGNVFWVVTLVLLLRVLRRTRSA